MSCPNLNCQLVSFLRLADYEFLWVVITIMDSISSIFPYTFGRGQNEQEAGAVSSQRVRNTVVNRFLRQSTQFHKERPISLKEINSRLVSTVFDHNQTFEVSDRTPTSDDVFDWFINSNHASGLYRRAIEARDHVVESFYRESGIDINQADPKTGNTPLMLAARSHQPVLTQCMITKGADILAVNARNENACYQAIRQCLTAGYDKKPAYETIKTLLDAKGLPAWNSHVMDIVFTQTDRKIAELFLDFPISFEHIVTELANSKRSDAPEILRAILSRYPELVNVRDDKRMTLLMIAASLDNLPALKVLLEQPDIDIEASCLEMVTGFSKKWTAFNFAFEKNHIESTQLLMRHGACKFFPAPNVQEISHTRLMNRLKNLAFIFCNITFFATVVFLFHPEYQNYELVGTAVALHLLACALFYYSTRQMHLESGEISLQIME